MATMVQAAQIAGIQPALLRMWFKRGIIVADAADRRWAEPGDNSDLSPNSVLAIAITAALSRLDVPLDRAAHAGTMFAHTNIGRPQRAHPGALYSQPGVAIATIIIVPAEGDPVIMPVTSKTDPFDLIIAGGARIIVIDDIIDRVTNAFTGALPRQRRPA